jgi:hypothetical protein
MSSVIIPDIEFRKGFEGFADDPFYRALVHIKGNDHSFRSEYSANEASNILKYKQLITFSKFFKENGFKRFMPVKGMYLLNNLFSDYQGIRPMVDIDFIVHPDEFRKIPAFLKKHPEIRLESNFHPVLRKFFGEDFSFIWNGTVIELHSKITLASVPGLIEEVFENSKEKANPDGTLFLAPDIEYMAVLMLLHDYSRSDLIDLTCRRLLEFYIVLSNCDIEKLTNLVQKHDLERMLECHLYLISKMTEENLLSTERTELFNKLANIVPDMEHFRFIVENKETLSKFLYGKKWKKLKSRNIAAGIFKKIAGTLK